MVSKKMLWIFILVFVIFMSFLAIGSFDYDFSKAIVNPDSVWANFFDQYGEIPAFLLLLIGVTILFGARKKEVLWRNVLSHALSLPFMLLFSYVMVAGPINYMYDNHETGIAESIPASMILLGIVLGLIIFIMALVIERKVSRKTFDEMKKMAILFILLVVLEILVVNVVKIVWGRPRMRILESAEGFKKWYQINGKAANNQMKSFPSGHTANGFATIAFTSLFVYIKNINTKFVMAFAIIWGTLVALSRVVLGAHFLSDVIVGSYITIFIFFALSGIFLKERKNLEG